MEIVIALIIFAGLAYYLFSKHRQVESEQEPAPYKVEPPAVPMVVAGNPVVVETPVVAAKKPRQPRQTAKPVAKTAAKPAVKKAQPAKKPAAIQAASKAKKPRTPKAK